MAQAAVVPIQVQNCTILQQVPGQYYRIWHIPDNLILLFYYQMVKY